MMDRGHGSGMGWGARIAIAVVLIVIGAAAATWTLARWQGAARVLGVAPAQTGARAYAPPPPLPPAAPAAPQVQDSLNPVIAEQIGELQARVQRVESESEEVQGSAGRADALLIAFSARRAIERGVRLGYLEPLLVDRFGKQHPQAVARIVTTARAPVRLSELITRYQDLQQDLTGPPPDEGLWTGFKRGIGSLVSVRRSDRPSTQPQARYDRALSHMMSGEVDSALAETMRLPGAPRANEWVRDARRYVATHRALDEIESAALVGGPAAQPVALPPAPAPAPRAP
ncbi:hypothetical protein H8M03_08530 [Sphingomonas sabuli]|uniref:Inner membrane protein n=1 Tax=Sphingomonas sabuli TaxID=2764186 RepID=A0A7G9L0D0_9SPHN|nr:hypothetical protein [Sphingomonas sabuli]QNM82079.1 hypothetical protein H8M03_08530 [Sphingomonas sabuli]